VFLFRCFAILGIFLTFSFYVIIFTQFFLLPPLYLLPLNLEGKILYGDRAYNDYFAEDALRECDNVKLEVIRKKNSKRFDYYKQKLVAYFRKTVETAGSNLTMNFPKKIHAVTLDGFIRKIYYFVSSFNINYLIKLTYN